MDKQARIEELEAELERAYSNLARIDSQCHGYRRAYEKTYNRLRYLENAVRTAVDPASGVSLLNSLMKLSRMIPSKPRPTLRQARRSR